MKHLLLALLLVATMGAANAQQGRRPDNAPGPGTPIPRVTATTPDGKTSVVLSDPKRLTVLVFGSHT